CLSRGRNFCHSDCGLSKASRAAATAALTSATVAVATCAISSSVAGLKVAKVSPFSPARHWLLINNLCSSCKKAVVDASGVNVLAIFISFTCECCCYALHARWDKTGGSNKHVV